MNLSMLFYMYVGCSLGTFITYFWVRMIHGKHFPLRGIVLLFIMGPFVFAVLLGAIILMYLVEGIKYVCKWLRQEWEQDPL
jgi:hypothetical protein